MAYARRNTSEDIRANRAWTADTTADLANIPAKHGDHAFTTTPGDNYIYTDGDGWINLSFLLAITTGRLAFPAAQNAANDPNTLDDYEEGTWTPVIEFGNATTGITYTNQDAVYVKIGQLVCAQFHVLLSSKGSATGTASVSGLPFSSESSTSAYSTIVVPYYGGMASIGNGIQALVNPGTTEGTFVTNGATASSVMDDTNFSNTSQLIGFITYRVSD